MNRMKNTIPAILENIYKNQNHAKTFLHRYSRPELTALPRPELTAHNKKTRNNDSEVILWH